MTQPIGKIGIEHRDVEDAWREEESRPLPQEPAVSAELPRAASAAGPLPALAGLDLEEIEAIVREMDEKPFRARQLYEWVYHRRALAFDEMTNLSKDFRARLAERYRVHPIRLADRRPSSDGSAKLLFGLDDGKYVEGVLMPALGRLTLCVSSQVGCAVDCKFCLTGQMGFQRNLTAGEIVSQVLMAGRDPIAEEREPGGAEPMPLTNVVFMGMGEPLLNPRGVIGAIRLTTDTTGKGMGMSPRRITVSTAGVVPGIDKLSEAELNVKLAVSLNGTTDEQREAIMPMNRIYPIARLFEAIRNFKQPQTYRVTFEYVLMDGVNDSLEDADRLARLVSGIRCKINVIPFNPDPALPFRRPPVERVEAFNERLIAHRLTSSVRWSKGLDVDAACGQLAGRWRPE